MELAHATCNAVAGNGMGPESAYALRHREPSLSARYESASHANEIHVLPKHTRAPRDEPLVSEKDVGSKWVGIGRLLFGPGPGTNRYCTVAHCYPNPEMKPPRWPRASCRGVELTSWLTTPKPKAALSMAGAAVKRP